MTKTSIVLILPLLSACQSKSQHPRTFDSMDEDSMILISDDDFADTKPDENGFEPLERTEMLDGEMLDQTLEESESYAPMFLSFYYPWYGTPEFSGEWVHWKDEHHDPERTGPQGFPDIPAAHQPEIGLYDSNDPATLDRHIDLALRARLSGFIVSWWGIDSFEDKAGLKLLKRIEERNVPLKVTIYYEIVPQNDVNNAIADIEYILEKWARSPAFLRINDKPAIFVYSRAVRPRLDCGLGCPPDLPQFIDWKKIRSAVSQDIFLIADLKSPYLDNPMAILKDLGFDGWHFYIMAIELWFGVTAEQYYTKVGELASQSDLWFAATVIPGYDDTKLFDRSFTFAVDREDGSLFERLLTNALALKPFAILITSFNEWHEGTEIEPSVEFGDKFISILASF